MSDFFDQQLAMVRANPAILSALSQLQRGIEKESLRVNHDASLAQTSHPTSVGSALCHPKITTDYSEALLEFITPVHTSVRGCLDALKDVHRFTYEKISQQDELLWTASMPCQLGQDDDIPVAQYGHSNVAKMKTIYRLGLGHRYGRPMQTISGIHFNFSLSDTFWTNYQYACNDKSNTSDFKTQQYLHLIRNFRRYVPLFVYLFGASPALDKSFLSNDRHQLDEFDQHSCFNEYATSLRMGDLGYQSSAQESLFICYNSLDNYISSLRKAITEGYPDYGRIGIKNSKGEYQQLNDALLQIENEFYSTIRPKRVAASGEAPINALVRGGIEYIEVRCIDVSPFSPMGIDERTVRFLDIFLLYCLFEESPVLAGKECLQTTTNLKHVVNEGRRPDVSINHRGKDVSFHSWMQGTLEKMQPLAETLDSLHASNAYQSCLSAQMSKVGDVSQTPSAQVLAQMRAEEMSFKQFSLKQSHKWQSHFLNKPLSDARRERFEELAADSLAQQQAIEQADNVDFDAYIKHFYQQYLG